MEQKNQQLTKINLKDIQEKEFDEQFYKDLGIVDLCPITGQKFVPSKEAEEKNKDYDNELYLSAIEQERYENFIQPIIQQLRKEKQHIAYYRYKGLPIPRKLLVRNAYNIKRLGEMADLFYGEDGKGRTFLTQAEVEVTILICLETIKLKVSGRAFRKIDQILKVPVGYSKKCYDRFMDYLVKKCPIDVLKEWRLDLERLDEMFTILWPCVKEKRGWAIESALKIMERRAKMMGLDMPEQYVVKHSMDEEKKAQQRVREILDIEIERRIEDMKQQGLIEYKEGKSD